MNPLYQNQLNTLLTNPGSFQGTPGYQFALDQGLQATERSNSGGRNSGNALAALAQYGSGLASQNYGNQRDFLGKMVGQEQQYGLGQEQNANASQANANTAQNNAWNYSLGQTRNANDAMQNTNAATRNANDFTLGKGTLANNAQNNWWNYDISRGQNANQASQNANNFTNAQGRLGLDWYGAQTNRGEAQNRAWLGNQANARAWGSQGGG